MEMTVQLDLEFTQIKNLVDRLPKKEKQALARYLDDRTLFDEIRRGRKRTAARSAYRA